MKFNNDIESSAKHSCNKYLLSVFYAGTFVLDTGDIMVSKTDGGPWSHGSHLVGIINANFSKVFAVCIGLCFMLFLLISFNTYTMVGIVAILILYKNKLRLREVR